MKYLAVFLEWSCCRGCDFVAKKKSSTKSAKFWSQNVPLVLTKKTSTRPVYIESRVCVVKDVVECSFEYKCVV